MRRSLLLLLVCALLGVVTTIALAWTCAALVNPETIVAEFSHSPRADGGDDVIVVQRGFGHTRINRAQCQQLLLDDTGSIRIARWAAGGEQSSETRAGWPWRAFACSNPNQISLAIGSSTMAVQTTSAGSNAQSNVRGGWELPPFSGGGPAGWRAIPLRPIWSGLIVNVLALGGLWFVVFAGVGAWRRGRRRERGCCAGCGYDLRSGGMEGQRCPECGEERGR